MPKSFVKINKLKFGYYLWSITEKEMYIHNIDIYPKFQGKGLFKILMNDIKNNALKNNCDLIRLQPCPQQKDSYFNEVNKLKELYIKHGFIEIKTDKYKIDGDDSYDDNFMEFKICIST